MKQSVLDAILNAPALNPPPGVTPNFENPSNLSQPGLAVLQLVVATLVVALRLYTKLCILGKMLAEDYWLIAAWLCFMGFQVVAFMLEELPMGVHQWDLTIRKAIENAKLFDIAVTIYAVTLIPLKVTLILQIRRIFTPHDRSLRTRPAVLWVIDSFLAMNVMFYIALFLLQFLACRPLAHSWNPLIPGTCATDKMAVHIVSAAINLASDLIMVILPQPVIWKLNLTQKRRWGLSAVFLLGGLACAASAVRLYYATILYRSKDQTYQGALMGKWAEPEMVFGFLAASLPVLPAFIKHVRGTALGLKMRGLWTSSPLTDARSRTEPCNGSNGPDIVTIGSCGRGGEKGNRIMKVIETDIEFEELTRQSRDETGLTVEESRASSSKIDEKALVVGRSRASSPGRDEEWGIGAMELRQKGSVGPLRQ